MANRLFLFLLSAILFSCNNSNKTPDVSNIKIDLTTQRFERDLFKIDTNNIAVELEQLQAKYPSFGENFLTSILNADPRWGADTMRMYVGGFIGAYKPIFDTAEIVFKDFTPYQKEIEKGVQFVKHYFPEYKTPNKIITYLGPMDGYGDILADDAFIVGLHHHLGGNYSLYSSEIVMQTYPIYMSQRFEPSYISVNCMKNIVNDMYPEKEEDRPLIEQMVEKGKRLYVLSKLLPEKEEHKLIGYTEKQMKDCYDHEKAIWDLFVQNSYLQITDKNIVKNYIGENPKTQELGDASPGNIGAFVGWQIIKKYMSKNDKLTLQQLMAANAESIFQETKYKP